MRNIKFRYWNTITGIMVTNPKMPHKEGWTIEQLFEERGWIWEQFTGLKDKNGKEIYEGDIVKELGEVGVIIFWAGKFVIDWKTSRKHNFSDSLFHHKEVIEIIGNIHQNEELINK